MSAAEQIAKKILSREGALRDIGLRSLFLFGSAARGHAGHTSDVDLLYEFEAGAATLDHLLDLQEILEAALGLDVDLVPNKHVSPILRRHIEPDVVSVYQAGPPLHA